MRIMLRLPVTGALLRLREPFAAVEVVHDLYAARWLRRHPDIDVVMPYHGAALRTWKWLATWIGRYSM